MYDGGNPYGNPVDMHNPYEGLAQGFEQQRMTDRDNEANFRQQMLRGGYGYGYSNNAIRGYQAQAIAGWIGVANDICMFFAKHHAEKTNYSRPGTSRMIALIPSIIVLSVVVVLALTVLISILAAQ